MRESEEIIKNLKTDANAAYQWIYKYHFPSIKNFVLKNNGRIEDAEDLFQDALIIFLEKLKQDEFILTATVKTYITAIAKNIWLNKLRGKSYLNESFDSRYHEVAEAIDHQSSMMERLMVYVAGASKHCQSIIYLMFFENKTIEDIQVQFGYTTKHNAINQKHKCIKQIKKIKNEDKSDGFYTWLHG